MHSSESEKRVYEVTHCAFKTEYVIACDSEEARDAATAGWDTGDYTYGHPYNGRIAAEIGDLAELPGVGGITVQKLLEADSPLSLAPNADTPLRQRDETRLKNALEENLGSPL